jgi:large repetitive protein
MTFLIRYIAIVYLLVGLFTQEMDAQCQPNVPNFNVDLTGNPTGSWTSPSVIRQGYCCNGSGNDRCISFYVTLDPSAVGVSLSIISGAVPGGALNYSVNCGTPSPVGSPICLDGPGPHHITFCKPGNNENIYQLTSIPGPTAGTNITLNDGCTGSLSAEGYTASTVTWNSISPGISGQYNNYLSCTSGCLTPTVTATGTPPDFVDYVVCGVPAANCVSTTVCDTVRVSFNPTLHVNIVPQNPVICFGETSATLTANGIGGTPPYSYLWNNVNPSQTIVVGAGTYNVMLSDASGCPPVFNSVTVTSFTNPISANAGPDQVVCIQHPLTELNGSVSGASGGIWSGGNGIFSPGSTSLANVYYSPTPAELNAGSVTLYLTSTGNGGCPAHTDTIVIDYLDFSGTPSHQVTNVSCYGLADGSIEMNVTGGLSPYSYTWNTFPAQTGNIASNLPIGTYSVEITDAIGCVHTSSATIEQPMPLNVGAQVTNVSCFGLSDGEISAFASGGTTPYTYYTTETNSTGALTSNLDANLYTITATDANLCQSTSTFTVTQPNEITGLFSSSDVSCHSGSDGSASISVSGGTSPYAYFWPTNGSTSNSTSGLSAGTYTVEVTDINQCIQSFNITINQPLAPININLTSTPVSCNGEEDGQITATVTGGTGGYTYLWSNGSSNLEADNLSAGNYSLTITDDNNCQFTAFTTVPEPTPVVVNIASLDVLCFGQNTGSAIAQVNGGSGNYTYLWSNNETSQQISNLSAGNISVTVTDDNNCEATASSLITQPTAPIATDESIISVSCPNGTNGSISTSTQGGTVPYTYLWLPFGQTTPSVSNLSVGNYTLTVTDQNNCTLSETYTVQQIPQMEINVVPTPASCFGGDDGSAASTVSGGTAPYSYNWSPSGGTNAIGENLSAGNYTLTVTDNLGCSKNTSVQITEPLPLSLTTTATPTSCQGAADGGVQVTVQFGTAPYNYLWTPGNHTTSTVSNLSAGNYSVIVTDVNGCQATASAIINSPDNLTISLNQFNPVTCFGGTNGSIAITAIGGTPNYSYSWSPVGGTGATATQLVAGNYTLTVTDQNGCNTTQSFTMTQPTAPIAIDESITSVSCPNGTNGSISTSTQGGTAPYTYLWLPFGQTTPSVSNLSVGNYTLTVTDQNNCTLSETYTVQQIPQMEINVVPTPASCFGGDDGSAASTVSGGTAPYSYNWSPSGGTNAIGENLSAGNYTLTVTDNLGCSKNTSVQITEPLPLSLTTTATPTSCQGAADGGVQVTVQFGTAPYNYLWTPGNHTTSTVSNLSAGNYSVIVTDVNGCQATASAIINSPDNLTISLNQLNPVTCFGGANGSIAITAIGGTPNYSYSWSPVGGTGATATQLVAGNYTLTVTDQNGCNTTQSFTITEPTQLSSIVTAVSTSCYGGADGTASINMSGGNGPYSFVWIPSNNTTSSASGLQAGNYTINVLDAHNCNYSTTVFVPQPDPIELLSGAVNSDCGQANGIAHVTVNSGGTGPFTYLWLPVNQTTAIASDLFSGIYTVTVTDANGCTAEATGNVNENAAPAVQITVLSDVTCFGGNDGSAVVSTLGGIEPFTYLWTSNGQTTTTASNLNAGIHSVTVTGDNNCSASATIQISQPTALSLSVSTTPVTCFGGNDGTATVTGYGGVGNYSFEWLPSNQIGNTISNLAAGTSTVVVTDGNNCSFSQDFTVVQPLLPLSLITQSTPVLCHGGNTGTATVLPSGGTAPYAYMWNPSAAQSQTAAMLGQGNYTVTVTDANGCEETNMVTVNQPDPIVLTTATVSSNCSLANGSATVNASGGVGGYSYLWLPLGGTNASADNLLAGNYTVQVNDANNCSASALALVEDIAAPVASATVINSVSCFGGNDGAALASATGGLAPYSFEWFPGNQTDANPNNLTAGVYTVLVTTNNGCLDSSTIVITEPLPMNSLITTTPVSCFGGNDGAATVTGYGGVGNYSFEWLPSNQIGNTISNLAAGTSTVVVTDGNNCSFSQDFTVVQPLLPLSLITQSTPVLCHGGNTGTATVLPSGGTAPYAYMWNPSAAQSQTAAMLGQGNYTVTVTDANGCEETNMVTVNQPDPIVLTTTTVSSNCSLANGSATVNASGGVGGYSYLWLPLGGTNASADNLLVGNYTVQVNDANNCSASALALVEDIAAPVASATVINSVSCFGGNDGAALASATGGLAPYSFEWFPGNQTDANANNLTAGVYTVIVTDANGCPANEPAEIIISEPNPLIATLVTQPVSCFGNTDGTATVNVIGGTPNYTYVWSISASSTQHALLLPAGLGTVTIQDGNNCMLTTNFEITTPQPLSVSSNNISHVNCFEGADGTAEVAVIGGTPLYNYLWSNGNTSAIASGLAAGTYTVEVVDINNCSELFSLDINQPSNTLTSTAIVTPTTCYGQNNGQAEVIVSGGTPNYSYNWFPGGFTSSVVNTLEAIDYIVSITDNNGCQHQQLVTIDQPTPLESEFTVVHPSCGLSNGSLLPNVQGGTSPYSFFWVDLNESGQTAQQLSPGNYTLVITDNNACSITIAEQLVNIPGPHTEISSIEHVSCNNLNDGSATIDIMNGTAPYSITWLPYGGTSITAQGLFAGTFTAEITDAIGCETSIIVEIIQPYELIIDNVAVQHVSCNGLTNGSISVQAAGGTSTYNYDWNTPGSNSSTLSGIGAGVYTVNITDGNGCQYSNSYNVNQPNALLGSTTNTIPPTCHGGNNAQALVTVTGGTAPYEYLWNTGETSNQSVNLSHGSYTVDITDLNGCETTHTVSIIEPNPIITQVSTNDTICLGQSAVITATATGGTGNYTFGWQPTAAVNNGNYSVTPTESTTYSVVAYDQNGCAGNITSVSIDVLNLTAENVEAIAFSPICPGQLSILYAEITGISANNLSYTWDNGVSNGPGGHELYPQIPTTYTVTVSNSCGLTAQSSVTVEFNDPPQVVILAESDTLCAPSLGQFYSESVSSNPLDPIISWEWNFSNGAISSEQNPSIEFVTSGYYEAHLTVTTAGGCVNSNSTDPFLLVVAPTPIANFSINNSVLEIPIDILECTNLSIGANSYQWSFGDGSTSNFTHPTHNYQTIGNFNIQLIAINEFGCADTAIKQVATNSDLVFPNAFTPDENGSNGGYYDIYSLDNDVFFPYTAGVEEFKLMIFNRWGELIFFTDDISIGWDGYYRDEICQQGVYAWKAYALLNDGRVYNKIGNVTLIRVGKN